MNLFNLIAITIIVLIISFLDESSAQIPQKFKDSVKKDHTNNWAVLVCTSRFWYNYRHVANTLAMYHAVKELGIPDSQIILMLADDMACNSRNNEAGAIFSRVEDKSLNIYSDDVEVDYRGYEVNVESFIRLLTGRHHYDTPLSKRLKTDETSNILLYMTGHSGDEFIKFQDYEELSSIDLSDSIHAAWVKGRWSSILFISDTCQAETLSNQLSSPNIISIGSALKGENSFSSLNDNLLGVSLSDRFTDSTLKFIESNDATKTSLKQLFNSYDSKLILSHPIWKSTNSNINLNQIPISDYFASIHRISTSDMNPLVLRHTIVGHENNNERKYENNNEKKYENIQKITTNNNNNNNNNDIISFNSSTLTGLIVLISLILITNLAASLETPLIQKSQIDNALNE